MWAKDKIFSQLTVSILELRYCFEQSEVTYVTRTDKIFFFFCKINDTFVESLCFYKFSHAISTAYEQGEKWKKWNREVVCIAGGHTIKSCSPSSSCCAFPKVNRLCMLKLNTDAMNLW